MEIRIKMLKLLTPHSLYLLTRGLRQRVGNLMLHGCHHANKFPSFVRNYRAILLAFMTQVNNAHEICSVTQLKSKLQGLFAESAAHYTDLALSMTFHANSMVADIQTYPTYLQNSSFADRLNHNEFLYSKLRAKMTAVNPNVLIQAASEHKRHLNSRRIFPHTSNRQFKLPT